jgi:hypothetical protein
VAAQRFFRGVAQVSLGAASEEGRRGRAASEAIASQCVNALLGSGERSMNFENAELARMLNGAMQRLRLLIKEKGQRGGVSNFR